MELIERLEKQCPNRSPVAAEQTCGKEWYGLCLSCEAIARLREQQQEIERLTRDRAEFRAILGPDYADTPLISIARELRARKGNG